MRMLRRGLAVLIVAMFAIVGLVAPASAGSDTFSGESEVRVGDQVIGTFYPKLWEVDKLTNVYKQVYYEWKEPDVSWLRFGGTQVKWHVRPYCHKHLNTFFQEVYPNTDVPMDDFMVRGPATRTPGDTDGAWHTSPGYTAAIGGYESDVNRWCSVIRMHFKPYVYYGGTWHAGETLKDYIRVMALI